MGTQALLRKDTRRHGSLAWRPAGDCHARGRGVCLDSMSSWSRGVSFWNRNWWTKVLFLVVLLSVLVWKADPAAMIDAFLHVDARWLLLAVAVDVSAIFLKRIALKILFDPPRAAPARG